MSYLFQTNWFPSFKDVVPQTIVLLYVAVNRKKHIVTRLNSISICSMKQEIPVSRTGEPARLLHIRWNFHSSADNWCKVVYFLDNDKLSVANVINGTILKKVYNTTSKTYVSSNIKVFLENFSSPVNFIHSPPLQSMLR